MGLLDNLKAFVHSITTEDHYASYDSPYRNDDNEPIGTNSHRSSTNDSALPLNNDLNNSQYSLDNSTGAAGFYRPGMKSSQQDLPLQNFSANGQPPLPSIDSLWDRIEYWIEQEYPELEDNLNDGVTTADLNEFMQDLQIGRNLPDDFRQFYKRHDGQLRGGKPTGLIMGLVLLDLEAIVEEKILWTKVAERLEGQYYMAQHKQRQDNIMKEGSSNNKSGPINNSFVANQRSIPPNSIQPYYYHKGWVILLKDNIGNQVAMDLLPGPAGQVGQIILFGRDFDTKLVIASSLQEFLFGFVTDLEQGNFQIDSSEYQEQLGFLSNDRNGDFMVGDEDEDQGELSFWDKDGQEFGKNVIRGRLSYIEVLKRRALKKYGLSETFETSFVPQRIPKKQQPQQKPSGSGSGSTTPIISQSRNASSSNLKKTTTNGNAASPATAAGSASTATTGAGNTKNKPPVPSPLANSDNASSSFSIPKETILNKNKPEKEEKEDKQEVSSSEKATVESKDPIETVNVSVNTDKEKPESKAESEAVKADDKESEEIKVTKNNDTEESEKKVEPEPEPESEVVANAESLEEQQTVESSETTETLEVETKEESKKDTKEKSNDETKEVTDGLKEVEL